MIAARLVATIIGLASFATACSAIVAAQLGDTGDFSRDGSARSPGSEDELDECSLQRGTSVYITYDANPCSECIATECAAEVEYACNRGGREKDWFDDLKRCAQNPWDGFSPPGSNASFYGCGPFEKELPPISSNGDDAERKRAAEICVHDKCLQGDLPACRRCEVSTRKTGVDDRALLRDDPCGSCLVEHCEKHLVRCCDTEPMQDFVEQCAFTPDPWNKTVCNELGAEIPDAGRYRSRYDDAGGECLSALSECFKEHCAEKGGCR